MRTQAAGYRSWLSACALDKAFENIDCMSAILRCQAKNRFYESTQHLIQPRRVLWIGGLSEFCKRATPVSEPFPFVRPIPPVLDMIYDTFGPHRMMWGSDYPPVARREGYGNSLRYTKDQFMTKSDENRAWIFGRTAAKVFPVVN
jgi:predicted TIM-barrel fold metal-dependent hydrolase